MTPQLKLDEKVEQYNGHIHKKYNYKSHPTLVTKSSTSTDSCTTLCEEDVRFVPKVKFYLSGKNESCINSNIANQSSPLNKQRHYSTYENNWNSIVCNKKLNKQTENSIDFLDLTKKNSKSKLNPVSKMPLYKSLSTPGMYQNEQSGQIITINENLMYLRKRCHPKISKHNSVKTISTQDDNVFNGVYANRDESFNILPSNTIQKRIKTSSLSWSNIDDEIKANDTHNQVMDLRIKHKPSNESQFTSIEESETTVKNFSPIKYDKKCENVEDMMQKYWNYFYCFYYKFKKYSKTNQLNMSQCNSQKLNNNYKEKMNLEMKPKKNELEQQMYKLQNSITNAANTIETYHILIDIDDPIIMIKKKIVSYIKKYNFENLVENVRFNKCVNNLNLINNTKPINDKNLSIIDALILIPIYSSISKNRYQLNEKANFRKIYKNFYILNIGQKLMLTIRVYLTATSWNVGPSGRLISSIEKSNAERNNYIEIIDLQIHDCNLQNWMESDQSVLNNDGMVKKNDENIPNFQFSQFRHWNSELIINWLIWAQLVFGFKIKPEIFKCAPFKLFSGQQFNFITMSDFCTILQLNSNVTNFLHHFSHLRINNIILIPKNAIKDIPKELSKLNNILTHLKCKNNDCPSMPIDYSEKKKNVDQEFKSDVMRVEECNLNNVLQKFSIIKKKKKKKIIPFNNKFKENNFNTGYIQLWQFLLVILRDPTQYHLIHWVGDDGEFKMIHPEKIAKMWGARKNKPKMNYEKLSRALRYYYEENIITKVPSKRFVYKFVCDLKHIIGYTAKELREEVAERMNRIQVTYTNKYENSITLQDDSNLKINITSVNVDKNEGNDINSNNVKDDNSCCVSSISMLTLKDTKPFITPKHSINNILTNEQFQ
ncbi:hypothetical protein A3Q56_04187 [Intoshia linei]|uniref:ETS domain-containing protein n=1 Tax=Intoshia linei TaxID=1819745 RepID=A0A177B370_9BILA|nr:hypothetical protein A3Q56_04187 [Intoshia linei]